MHKRTIRPLANKINMMAHIIIIVTMWGSLKDYIGSCTCTCIIVLLLCTVLLCRFFCLFFFCCCCFFQGTNKLSKKKKNTCMLQAKIHLATVCDCKTSWLLYSTHMYACAYNIDSLYNTGRIDPARYTCSKNTVDYLTCLTG